MALMAIVVCAMRVDAGHMGGFLGIRSIQRFYRSVFTECVLNVNVTKHNLVGLSAKIRKIMMTQQPLTLPTVVTGTAPTRAHQHDAGLDLYAAEQKMIHPHSHEKIRLGVKVAIPKGYVGILVPRSSLGTRDLGLANDIGVIDSGFTGELCALIQNRGRVSQVIREGDKIVQLLIIPIVTPNITVVQELAETDRGDGGFGSTGEAA